MRNLYNLKIMYFIKIVFSFICFILISVYSFGNPLELTLEEFANEPLGKVFFLRHTLAPGFDANGEPEKFNIEDCSTQRNLNITGRKQAKKLGEEFVNYGIRFRKIFSSQWCRCIETGELLNLGQVSLESSLNSGFKGIFKKEKSLLILKKILEALNDDDEPILMVTHYGTILATTGISVDSGGGVVYNLKTRESKKILLK